MSAARPDIILAFDVGSKKTGVAVGNHISGGARPLGIVCGGSQHQLEQIAEYIREWAPGLLVVGLPLHMDGASHRMTLRARRFSDCLRQRFSLPVMLADERNSSMLARRRGGAAAHQPIDDNAAAVILQHWLDSRAIGDIMQ